MPDYTGAGSVFVKDEQGNIITPAKNDMPVVNLIPANSSGEIPEYSFHAINHWEVVHTIDIDWRELYNSVMNRTRPYIYAILNFSNSDPNNYHLARVGARLKGTSIYFSATDRYIPHNASNYPAYGVLIDPFSYSDSIEIVAMVDDLNLSVASGTWSMSGKWGNWYRWFHRENLEAYSWKCITEGWTPVNCRRHTWWIRNYGPDDLLVAIYGYPGAELLDTTVPYNTVLKHSVEDYMLYAKINASSKGTSDASVYLNLEG